MESPSHKAGTWCCPASRQKDYEIRPLVEGQLNLAYFELLAEILDPQGTRVGLCFVELLPGVRNPGMKVGWRNMLKRV